jgi:hypothetical protein
MGNLKIGQLQLSIHNAQDHAHRLGPVASVAAGLFAERVQAHNKWPPGDHSIDSLSAAPMTLDFGALTDHDAATQIAGAWFDALITHFKKERSLWPL